MASRPGWSQVPTAPRPDAPGGASVETALQVLVEVPLWLASMVPLSPLIAAGLLLILARAVARAARPWAWTPRVLRGPTGATTP